MKLHKMAEKQPNSRVSNLRLLLLNSESLESLLEEEDLDKFCSKLVSHKVITGSKRDNFTCLDPDKERLPPDTRVRYLLQQVWERAREDGQVYSSFVSVLRKLGGAVRDWCDTMGKEKSKMEEDKVVSCVASVGGRYLNEKDISNLLEVISEHYLWEEIGWALGLPKRVIEECRKSSSNVLRLSSVLLEWMKSAGFDGVPPATVDSLRAVLSSKTVGLLCCANKLPGGESSGDTLHVDKPLPRLLFQSDNTDVLEGKSTLLEVQVAGSGEESYQWSKEGRPLVEGRDFCGVSSNMLYINRASQQRVEGRYSCSISNGRGAVYSDEIDIKVVYSPEKEHLLQYYHGIKNNRECLTFVHLVLIKQKCKSRCDFTIRGDVDDILENKKVAEYEEIFREHKEGEVVLIEGRPGSGKTTLVHQISQDWAQGKAILQGARHVFLVTLRHLNYSKRDISVSDIIDIFFDSEEIRKVVENEIKKSRGRGVCFILDGLDEYQNSNEESVIKQLINKKVLPSSMIIVASRPAATQSLRDKCARRVEVVGFTKDQINTYVETYPFESLDGDISDKVSEMKRFLDVHPNVHHMCYLPVQANIVCFLFDNKGVNIPHTESRIYEEFTVSTINRHKQRNNEQFQIQSLEELEGEDKLQFSSICKLAFEMTINSQQVVSKKEAQKFLHTTEGSFFSLLTVEHMSERSYIVEEVYTFHHLTFQEYLAARHLASLSAEDQLQIVSGISWIVDDILRNVKKFYCGIVKYEKLKACLRDETFLSNLLYDSEYLWVIQCAFESQQIELCDYAVKSSSVNLYGTTITPSDWSALGNVISIASTVVTKLVFDRVDISKDGVSAFLSSVSESDLIHIKELKWDNWWHGSIEKYEAMNILLSKLPSLQKLEILDINISKSVFVSLTNNVKLAELEVLRIYFDFIPCSYSKEDFKLLKFGSSKKVKVYYSCYDGEDSAISRKLLNYVFGSSAPQASDISWLYLHNYSEISSVPPERFSHCTDIVLVNCGIDDNRAEILASGIRASVLEKLVLDFNRISDSGAKALAEQLASSCGLKVFSVQCNSIRDSGAAALASSIAGIKSLRELDLQGNDIRDEGVVAIAKATEETRGLDLYLFNVEVTQEGISRVLELRANTNIKTMMFGSSWNTICDEGIETLRSIIKWGTLPVLRISATNINGQAANMENIRTVLTKEKETIGKSIRSLDVVGYVDEDSLPALCDILERAKFLNHLRIRDVCKDSVTLKKLYDRLKLLEHLFSVSMSRSKCLFPCLKFWVNIHELYISIVQLSSEDVDFLCEVLVQLKSLKCLRLYNVSIDDDGAIALAEALKDHTSLRELDISCNKFTSVGMLAFASVIRANNIQHLDISGNKTEGSCDDLALAEVACGDSLQSNICKGTWYEMIMNGLLKMKNLVDLNISDCGIGLLLEPLAEDLACCSQLMKLDISDNTIGSEGIVSLSEGLQFCHNLLELDLSDNNITPDAVPAIALVMENCCHLRQLDLSRNAIGIDGAALLVAAWTHKTVLTLDLGDSVESSCASSLLEGEEHCSGCSRLLQLYNFNDNIVIEVDGGRVLKLIS